jgi:TrmH family RNA methyltransferase
LVKRLRRLHDGSGRQQAGHFLAEGRRQIDGLLASGAMVPEILLRDDLPIPETWPVERIRLISAAVAARLSQLPSPPGYLAVAAIPTPPAPADPARGALVCVGVADPGNLGTLLRSAAAFGYQQAILVGGADPWSAKVLQSAMGVLGVVALHQLPADQSPAALPAGAALVPLVARHGVPPAAVLRRHSWIIVGSEAHGLPPAWRTCGHPCTLPMPGHAESLNAAIAGSLALYLAATAV